MPRTLEQIKTEIAERFVSNEYLPEYIVRTTDLENFADAVGEFLAPYILQNEQLQDIFNNVDLLRDFLQRKNMFLSGEESLMDLQDIAENRYKILLMRGTMNMINEIRRLVNDMDPGSQTNIEYRGIGEVGWIVERTSPLYRESSTALNTCYIDARDLVIFNLYNLSYRYTNSQVKEIIKRFFEPKHVRNFYNFI